MVEVCPRCSAPLEETSIVVADQFQSPKQARCSNSSCQAHYYPELIAETIVMKEALMAKTVKDGSSGPIVVKPLKDVKEKRFK